MAELADAPDSKSGSFWSAGSTPAIGIILFKLEQLLKHPQILETGFEGVFVRYSSKIFKGYINL